MTGGHAAASVAMSDPGSSGSSSHLPINPHPDIIMTNVTIFHPQLRDLLQPAGEKGKVLFINRMNIDCADFNTMKQPMTFSTLDFAAVCLTTGEGFMAAGGEQSELDIRPLLHTEKQGSTSFSSSSRGEGRPLSSARMPTSTSSARVNVGERSPDAEASTARPPPRWHLRTPTGGSINNSIFIQPDHATCSRLPNEILIMGKREEEHPNPSSREEEDNEQGHRGKRRREDNVIRSSPFPSTGAPGSTVDTVDTDVEGRARNTKEAYMVTDCQGRLGWSPSKTYSQTALLSGTTDPVAHSEPPGKTISVRVLVSNNDQTVRMFRLRPPSRAQRSGAGNGGSVEEGLEAGLPGLSRSQTAKLSTSINHTSFSPDGRHMVSVGDTPDVFLFSVDPHSGEFSKIATYAASFDASFSTAWSPDSLQFAVASQDGVISVWDVRSSGKVAELHTTQHPNRYRREAARVVKWSTRGDLLAYSEDSTYVHIVETVSFQEVQRIRVPSVTQVRGSGASNSGALCMPESLRNGNDDEPELEDFTTSLWATEGDGSSTALGDMGNPPQAGAGNGVEEYDWLGSTSPARFASGARAGASAVTAASIRPWLNGRRYREIGSTLNRSAMDRALLGDWSSTRRGLQDIVGERGIGAAAANTGRGTSSAARPGLGGSANAGAEGGPGSALQPLPPRVALSDDLARLSAGGPASVEAFLADLSDATERSASVWGLAHGSLGRRRGFSSGETDISGLTWDPDGDFLYISTDRLVLRYKVLDATFSSGSAALR